MSNDGRWRTVALAAAVVWPFIITSAAAHRLGAEVAVVALIGLSLTVSLGWLRLLTLYQPGCAAVGAWVSAWVLAAGQTLPVALVVGAAAGVVPALAALALTGGRPRLLMPLTSLFVTAATVGFLGFTQARPMARPTFVGIDFGGERTAYLLALLLTVVAYRAVVILRGSDVGRGWIAAGWAPALARASGIDPAVSVRAGTAMSGALAGLAGTMAAVLGQAGTDQRGTAITLAVAYLAIPIVAGAWSPTAALWAAGLYVIVPQFTGRFGVDSLVVAAIGLIAALLFLPRGLAGLAADVRRRASVGGWRREPSWSPP